MSLDIAGIGSIFDFGSKIIDKIFPDKTQADQAKAALALAQQQGELQEMQQVFDNAKAQLAVNQVEAASTSIFVAGWRPFIGWVCGAAFTYAFVLQPLMVFVATIYGHPLKDLPALDSAGIMPVLLGMLGLGGMRSYEKVKGAAPASAH